MEEEASFGVSVDDPPPTWGVIHPNEHNRQPIDAEDHYKEIAIPLPGAAPGSRSEKIIFLDALSNHP